MGAVIKSVKICDRHPHSSIENAVEAGLACVDAAGLQPVDVDMLINVGVYRDDNIMEPSIAALIQQKMALNLDPTKQDINRRTLSFDLMNGGCGFLNAVAVASATLATGATRYVLIVGGDVHPSRTAVEGYPYSAVGSAVLLAYSSDPDAGFGPVKTLSSTTDAVHGYVADGAMKDFGVTGRTLVNHFFQQNWQEHFAIFAALSIQQFLTAEQIDSNQIDVLVTSQFNPEFPARVASLAGLRNDLYAVDTYDRWGDSHTSSPGVCLGQLLDEGLMQPGTRILLLSVGAGMSAACSLYRA